VIEFAGAANPARPPGETVVGGRGYLAEAAGGGPGVLLLHAWWGLNDTIRDFADQLAVAGFSVLAPDLFDGRVATSVEQAEALVSSHEADEAAQLALEQVVLGAADELSGRSGSVIAAVGFSFGAAYALWLARQRPEQVGGVVVYYGTYPGVGGQAPVLGHFAADDPFEPADNVGAFEAELRAAGRQVQFEHYPATRHWFAEPDRPEYDAAAAALAWTRTVEFLRRQLSL
jgi:carboxymethylenebutenolidase